MAYINFLNALDIMIGPKQEIVVAWSPKDEKTKERIKTIHQEFSPDQVLLFHHEGKEGDKAVQLSPFWKPYHHLTVRLPFVSTLNIPVGSLQPRFLY